MGSTVSLPISSLWQKKKYQILIAGLVCYMFFVSKSGIFAGASADLHAQFDQFDSGKTTILYSQLKVI